MIAKSLHFGKALNAALLVLLLAVGTTKAFAQTQMAMLQHNDTISAYYGMNSLIEAVAVATEGDIITLSSGTFTATNITKAITLHGAGCSSLGSLGVTPTFVSGDFTIDIANNNTSDLTIEGIFFQGTLVYYNQIYHAKFNKCNFNIIKPSGSGTYIIRGAMYDVQFINCFANNVEIYSLNNNVNIYNSVFGSFLPYGTSINVYNSIFKYRRTTITSVMLFLYNSIVGRVSPTDYSNTITSNSSAFNCIEIDSVFTSTVQPFNCLRKDSYLEVFETFNGDFSFNETYTLKAEIDTTFLGTDGRSVGIYGGAMPYDPRPSYLILNRCNVASKSTVDGKLSVEIEVISEE